jgi:TolB protein
MGTLRAAAAAALAVLALAGSTGCKPAEAPKAKIKNLSVTGAGSALERLTSEDVAEKKPAISPNGAILLFEVNVYQGKSKEPFKQTLVAVDPNTRAQRTLYTSDNFHSDHPAWLPDASSYVYASDSPGSWSLVKALTASPNAAVGVIASGEVAPNVSFPTVSPDGKRVAFATRVRGTWNVAVINMDGSHLTLLGEGTQPSWSPDGGHVAFTRTVGDHDHIFIVNPDTGTDLVQLTSGEYDHGWPSWSPDAQYLVFSTDRGWNKKGPKTYNLFILARDGTGLTQLTSGDAYNIEPCWGRDNWIYFASDQAGNQDIWRLKGTGQYAELKSVAGPVPTASASASATPPPPPPGSATPKASGSAAPPPPPPPTGSQCMKDTDCKGDRICEKGACVSPTPHK